jgi:hypothetical protein
MRIEAFNTSHRHSGYKEAWSYLPVIKRESRRRGYKHQNEDRQQNHAHSPTFHLQICNNEMIWGLTITKGNKQKSRAISVTLLSNESAQKRYEGFPRSLRESVLPLKIRIKLAWGKDVAFKCASTLDTLKLACTLDVSPGSFG